MTTERDPQTRLVLSWLREDAHENAERVLLRTLDEVDATPQRRPWWTAWRKRSMQQGPADAGHFGTLSRERAFRSLGSGASLASVAAAVVLVVAGALGLSYIDLQGVGQASPSPTIVRSTQKPTTPTPVDTGGSAWWPQTSIDEVRRAQGLADAGDASVTWQLEPALVGDAEPWDAQILDRFPREVLGWEAFLYGTENGYASGEGGSLYAELVLFRCDAGRANPLYPDDPQVGGCAPTIDEFRFETVMLTIEQPVRRGPDGVWVVTEWRTLEPRQDASAFDHFYSDLTQGQIVQIAPPSEPEAAALVESFLRARVAGNGAEQYVHRHDDDAEPTRFAGPPEGEVPILYATSGGAAYERFEVQRGEGPQWPVGAISYAIRLFARDGTVADQSFRVVRQEDGGIGLMYDPFAGDFPTKEDGMPVPIPYTFLGGQVAFEAALPWNNNPDSLYLGNPGRLERFTMIVDPLTVQARCGAGPAPTDAEALARSIRSNPDLEATTPVAVRVGGLDALRIDVVAAPGAILCEQPYQGPVVLFEGGSSPWELGEGNRMRVYVLDLPRGSARILVIAVAAPEDEFERVLEAATPVVDSIEFRLP